MKYTNIYQALENRNNDIEIEAHGPFFCSERYSDGSFKKGVREPWLGAGYYFWDSRIEDAKWWGKTAYGKKGFIVCHTTYDQHSPLLYDLVGDMDAIDEFINCANLIKKKTGLSKVSFPIVLAYMKRTPSFEYKAIRVWPYLQNVKETDIKFPSSKMTLGITDKIQICFFDKTLLTQPYQIVYKKNA